MLYMLKFRRPMGVGSGLIGPCPTYAAAETLGRHYCATQGGPGYRFISVEPAILVTMDALPADVRAKHELPAAMLPKSVVRTQADTITADSDLETTAAAAGADRTAQTPEPAASPIGPAAPASKRLTGRIGQ